MVQPPENAAGEAEARAEVEEYLRTTALESHLNKCVNEVLCEFPEDPLIAVSNRLRLAAPSGRRIAGVLCRSIFLEGGALALEAEVKTGEGFFTASAPWRTTATEDSAEPQSKEQANEDQHLLPLKKGDLLLEAAMEGVRTCVAEVLLGIDPTLQEEIDAAIAASVAQMDLPRHATDAVTSSLSAAVARAGAAHSGLRLCDHIAALLGGSGASVLPRPSISLTKHVSVLPGWGSLQESMEMGLFIKAKLDNELGGGPSSLDGLEKSISVVADVLESSCEGGTFRSTQLLVDIAAEELLNRESNLYRLGGGREEDPQGFLLAIEGWLESKPIAAVMNPFVKEHRDEWMPKLLTSSTELCKRRKEEALTPEGQGEQCKEAKGEEAASGDSSDEKEQFFSVVATLESEDDISAAVSSRACNSVLISLGSPGTPTVSACVKAASKVRANGWSIVVGVGPQCTGGALQSAMEFSAHLAAGLGASQLHGGGFTTAAHAAGFNELLRLEAQGKERMTR